MRSIVKRFAFVAIVAGSEWLVTSSRPHAQPLFQFIDSIEVTVTNADAVFVGHVVSVEPVGAAGTMTMAVSVDETIKGDRGEKWRVQAAVSKAIVNGWKAHDSRLLVAQGGGALATVIDLSANRIAVYTEDFACLRTAEEVIRAAKDVARRTPPGVKRINTAALLFPPGALQGGNGYDYSTTRLTMPVDDHLEQRAHAILRDGTGVARSDAVKALKYFKSDENIRLMRSLLDDPTTGQNRLAAENMGGQMDIYFVRRDAYDVLKGWGIAVPEPITREESVHLDRVTSFRLDKRPDLSTLTAADVTALARFENLRTLDLVNVDMSESALEAIGRLTGLRHLGLQFVPVSEAALTHLSRLTHLEELDVRNSTITRDGLATIGRFASLKTLWLTKGSTDTAGIAELQRSRPELGINVSGR